MSITPKQYQKAEQSLRAACPSRAFPAIPNNCWVDSTMFGLTFSPDLGRVLRAALLGCLDHLRDAKISTVSAFYDHINQWQLTPVWKTYVTRMLLYFLFDKDAEDHLTCPLIQQWVEDFRKRTFANAKISGADEKKGGITQSAIFAILTSLSITNDIIVERKSSKHPTYYYTGSNMQFRATANLHGYERRIGHYTVKGEGVGHVIVGFLCNGDFYLYDNNFGIQVRKGTTQLPDSIQIEYEKNRKKDELKWYVTKVEYKLQFPTGVEFLSKTFAQAKDEIKLEIEKPDTTYFVYTKHLYNRVRKGEDILAKMQGAPKPLRLTVATPRIADVPPDSPESPTDSAQSIENELNDIPPGKRMSKLASCIRGVASTVPYKRTMLFDVGEQDPVVLSAMSTKFRALLSKIQQLDAADLRDHGTQFKHFIFTDIRDAKYGAKAIATFLQAHGYELLLRSEKGFQRRKVLVNGKPQLVDGKPVYRMVPTKKVKIDLGPHPPVEHGSNRVGLLQGNPVWKSPLGVEVRKKMLSVFNSRPDNIHGEQIRFMILDSKFKEGIDLYDVRYVHLMEPQITDADLKQAIGRATRFCGQRGLHFVPNVGWNLDVFLYETKFANMYPFPTDKGLFDAHAYMMAHSGLDLGMLELTRGLTVLAIQSAVDYDLTYKINNFKKQSEILDETDLQGALVLSVQTGGVKVVPIEDVDLAKCGRRSNKFFPYSVAALKAALRARKVRIPATIKREGLCKLLEDNPVVLQDLLNGRLRTPGPVVPLPKSEIPTPIPGPPVVPLPETPESLRTPGPPLVPLPVTPSDRFPEPPELPTSIEELPDLGDFFRAHELAFETNYMAQHASFSDFQSYIREKYAEYAWEAPVIANGCETIPKPGQPVVFSRSQDFVRHYLTPASPFRGLLAWHSVGTGKTCTAVATASSTFEQQGYGILWVTRNSLMADVWKNMFGAVCSIPLQKRIEAGKPLPAKQGNAKRLVKAWFDPISYRTLQNALIPMRKGTVNQLGQLLRQRNGADPLRKTFLIIDEVHKLMDGDLKPSEAADFDKLVGAIHNSYKVSGADSVRVLLMTATPITDNPAGLFRLLNVLIPEESRRFPAFEEFRKSYTKSDGMIIPEGRAFFEIRAKGLISYLNREFDPSTFAQPQFHHLPIAASGALLATDQELVSHCLAEEMESNEEDCDLQALKDALAAEVAALEGPRKEVAERKRTLKAEYKERIDACKNQQKTRKQARGKIKECLGRMAKTRKAEWKDSQQKAAKQCFKNPGAPLKFASVSELQKMADQLRKTRKSPKSTRSVDTTYAVRGEPED